MQSKSATDITRLEGSVDRLIKLCEQLKIENSLLRERQSALVAERARLIEKNELARSRVEAMVGRLRALETEKHER